MQALHRILWKSSSSSDVGFNYIEYDDTGDPRNGLNLAGTPVIASRSHGITVGMLVDDDYAFGLIASSITDPSFATAWRVAQVLPYVNTIRHFNGRFYSTLDRLVTVAAGSCNRQLLSSLADDFGCGSGDDFFELFEEVDAWPSSHILVDVWARLSDRERRNVTPALRAAIDTGVLDASSALVDRIDAAERQMKTNQHMGRRALQATSSR